MAVDPFSKLAPQPRDRKFAPGSSRRAAHSHPREPRRGRVRIGLGAAVVLLLTALAVAAVGTAVGQLGHSVDAPASGEPSGATTAVPGASTGADTDSSGSPSVAPADGSDTAEPDTGQIFVHVLGSVQRPGLFELREGARVVDVIAAAGGLLPTADQAGVNLARPVVDGEQLYVPAQGEVAPGPPAGSTGGAAGEGAGPAVPGAPGTKVNLNTATLADLDTLPRIGPAMAQRILDYREANGRFSSIEDLQNVTGVGEKTFAALQDLITV